MEKFEALRQTEKDYFTDMVKRCKDSGATLIICQWGFDDEANHLLMANDLPCEPEHLNTKALQLSATPP